MEKIDNLIECLLDEKNEKTNIKELSKEDKKRLFRSLCNIRDAQKISDEFLKLQNEYLEEELKAKGIIEDIENSKIEENIYLWKGDITTLKIESIVNAGNSEGIGCFIPCHKCIDNSIHSASGIQLRLECNEEMKKIQKLKTGNVFITKGYNLPSKYVIHTVGPIIYESVKEKERTELEKCYINSLEIAKKNKIREIAFCCISTGEFRFPKDEACKIAIKTIRNYMKNNFKCFDKIVFNVFTDEDYKIYLRNLGVKSE